MDFQEYAQAFNQVEADFEASVEAFGVRFEETESSPRTNRIKVANACGCHCENNTGSLWQNWISPACLACRTGEATSTFFVDLRCSRSCYFCFNPNQDYYDYFLSHSRDITGELEQLHTQGMQFDCLAITGGEPLLHKQEVLRFVSRARRLYPQSHIRLYTSGDFLDPATIEALGAAGLTEIRFSVKLPEGATNLPNRPFEQMQQARAHIPAVMIEMPAIPGTSSLMKKLLVRADEIGITGINLLEFCFPLHNGEEFAKRGFKLRKHPYDHLYNYWYGGGIPVAGSEAEALRLMRFATEEKLELGMHYCSSDNKNTGQIYQQNLFYENDVARQRYPWLEHDADSRFLVCAKAFGKDAAPLHAWAEKLKLAHDYDRVTPSVAFPMSALDQAQKIFPNAIFAKSHNVFEQDETGAPRLREVSVSAL